MNKKLQADMVKDGYTVVITERYHVPLIQDVYAIARYNGLIVDEDISVYGRVYAG